MKGLGVIAAGLGLAYLFRKRSDGVPIEDGQPAPSPLGDSAPFGGAPKHFPLEVAKVRTELSERDARAAVVAAYQALTGENPKPETLALLMAQSAFETARWRSMYGNNFGNVTTDGSEPHYILDVPPFKTSDGRTLNYQRFLNYETPTGGAQSWLYLLQHRYPEAWKEAHESNPNGRLFVEALKRRNYFGGPLQAYATGVQSLQREYARLYRRLGE